MPAWLDPAQWTDHAQHASDTDVRAALDADAHSEAEFAALISPAAAPYLEDMAVRAKAATQRHFGHTISLYAPLYLADYCSAGCVYCGFSSDLDKPRMRLSPEDLAREMQALKEMGINDILLLTGDRTGQAGFEYLRDRVSEAAEYFDSVSVEAFTMKVEEYAALVDAGCDSIALYQETYDTKAYIPLHRWGPKSDYLRRLHGPETALRAGMRSVGVGALLGLCEPRYDMLAVYRHAAHLRRSFWRAGVSISFPRMRPQFGDYEPNVVVDDRMFAQIIFAFRICMPDVPLVLSTRETPAMRDGMAGIGVSRMSVASRTTVGGYADEADRTGGQFDISDERDVETFCGALRDKGLEPVFKNWDSVYRSDAAPTA